MSAGARRRGLLASLLFALSPLASADGISLNPVRVELMPGQKAAAVTVTNNDAIEHVLQASVVRWTQPGGEPVYEPATELIVSPALFKVPAHHSQLVRLGFGAQVPDRTAEATYRLFLEEVPEGRNDSNTIRMLMRFGLPVFINPVSRKDDLAWQLQALPDQKLRLTLQNLGNRHIRVDAVRLFAPGGEPVAQSQGLNYVLAAGQFQWQLDAASLPADLHLHLHAESDRGVIDADLIASR